MIKPEPQSVNVTNEIHQEMDVTALITKLDGVITVMNIFDTQVNLGNIYGAITQIAQQINFLQDEDKGYFMLINLLRSVHAKLENTDKGIRLLSTHYGEMTRNIATGGDKLIQNIGNLVNQQKAVIDESNKQWNSIEARFQGIENKPDLPAIADFQAMIPRQREM